VKSSVLNAIRPSFSSSLNSEGRRRKDRKGKKGGRRMKVLSFCPHYPLRPDAAQGKKREKSLGKKKGEWSDDTKLKRLSSYFSVLLRASDLSRRQRRRGGKRVPEKGKKGEKVTSACVLVRCLLILLHLSFLIGRRAKG